MTTLQGSGGATPAWEHDGNGHIVIVEPECCGRPIQHPNFDAGGNPTTVAYEECCGSPEPKATLIAQSSPEHAALIVRAVNAHDDLVAALQFILEHIEEREPRDLYPAFGLNSLRAIEMARAAIRKAGAAS